MVGSVVHRNCTDTRVNYTVVVQERVVLRGAVPRPHATQAGDSAAQVATASGVPPYRYPNLTNSRSTLNCELREPYIAAGASTRRNGVLNTVRSIGYGKTVHWCAAS
jgi:hypothetical protein